VALQASTCSMRITCAPCKTAPLLSVALPSHDLEPLVAHLRCRGVRDYQIVINQGSCLRQFRAGVQVKLKHQSDQELCLLSPAAAAAQRSSWCSDDFDIDLSEEGPSDSQ
jgi:hypothetical protein